MSIEEYEEKDILVLLEFQDREASKFLDQPSMFFRMLNLNEEKPIVEIGSDVYEGVYDEAIGTNVYFEEVESPLSSTNIFQPVTPISLQYLMKQTKILRMKKIGIKAKPVLVNNTIEIVNVHIDDDYRVLLEKYENGTLSIDEYVVKDKTENENDNENDECLSSASEEPNQNWKPSQLPARQNLVPEWYMQQTSTQSKVDNVKQDEIAKFNNITYSKYLKLQRLVEQPTRHTVNADKNEHSLPKQLLNMPKSNFYTWKNLMLRITEEQPVYLDINKDNIEDFVDIDKSIKAGIIGPSNMNPRIFTKEEKQELINFKNFVNVSPIMKLIMIQDYLFSLRSELDNLSIDEQNSVGEDGVTLVERFTLIEQFRDDLKSHIYLRLQDQLANEGIEVQNLDDIFDDLDVKEDSSDTEASSSSDDEAIVPDVNPIESGVNRKSPGYT